MIDYIQGRYRFHYRLWEYNKRNFYYYLRKTLLRKKIQNNVVLLCSILIRNLTNSISNIVENTEKSILMNNI